MYCNIYIIKLYIYIIFNAQISDSPLLKHFHQEEEATAHAHHHASVACLSDGGRKVRCVFYVRLWLW